MSKEINEITHGLIISAKALIERISKLEKESHADFYISYFKNTLVRGVSLLEDANKKRVGKEESLIPESKL